MDDVLLRKLKASLKEKINFELEEINEIHAGLSNKLFKLSDKTGKKVLLKIYWQDPSSASHLEREFEAIKLMRNHGITAVPFPHFQNSTLHYAVYSFEEGDSKKEEDLHERDIRRMVEFLVSVHSIKPNNVKEVFRYDKNFSLEIYTERVLHRIKRFKDASKEKNLPEFVLKFNSDIDPITLLETRYDSLKKLSGKMWEENLAERELRYSPQDFGPHNSLFRKDEIVFLDFEYFCFSDPLFLVSEFTQHDKTYGVPEKIKKLFLKLYTEKMSLPAEKKKRLEILILINELQWLGIYLDTMIPTNLSQFNFSTKDFDEEDFIRGQIKKFKARLV